MTQSHTIKHLKSWEVYHNQGIEFVPILPSMHCNVVHTHYLRPNKSPLFQKKFPSCALQDFLQKLLSQEDDLIWAQCAQGSSGRNPWMVLKMIIFTNASNCFNVGAILAQHSLVIPASSRLRISRVRLVMMKKDVRNYILLTWQRGRDCQEPLALLQPPPWRRIWRRICELSDQDDSPGG